MNNPKKIVDGWLVVQCQSGNEKAVALLVKRWHSRFCKQAYWYTRDRDVAKDIAQECWGVILKKISFLRDPNSFGSWAMKIVIRKAIDWDRKNKNEREKLESHYDLSNKTTTHTDPSVDDERILILRKSIAKLPQKQQVILNLFYLDEFSIKEVSEILQISVGTVKSRLFTAREKLKTIIKNNNHEK